MCIVAAGTSAVWDIVVASPYCSVPSPPCAFKRARVPFTEKIAAHGGCARARCRSRLGAAPGLHVPT